MRGSARRHVPGERQTDHHDSKTVQSSRLDQRAGEDLQIGRIEDQRVVEVAIVDEADM